MFLTRRQARAQLVVAMAGRAAEEAHLGDDFTQGAAHDIKTATQLARRMVSEYGPSTPPSSARPSPSPASPSDATPPDLESSVSARAGRRCGTVRRGARLWPVPERIDTIPAGFD